MEQSAKADVSESWNYQIQRTGLNRLCIMIDGFEEPCDSPCLVVRGFEVMLLRDEAHAVTLPDFPRGFLHEILRGGSIMIGERAMGDEPEEEGAMPRMQRFYEAAVHILSSEGAAVSGAALA